MAGKRGPWSAEEKKYIEEHYQYKTPAEIANYLQRDEKAVEKYIKDGCHSQTYKMARTAEYHIQSTPIWTDIKAQFNEEEQEMFLYHWGRIISQFQEDVFPTEEWQIVDAVKLEILMNRYLRQQADISSSINSTEGAIQRERNTSPPDYQRIESLERLLSGLRASIENINSVYRDMLNRKNNILKDMKATRDARCKDIETGKQSWSAWIRKIVENKDLRVKLGKDMEKMRLAANVEFERLSHLHTFADGTIDQPIINSENVIEEN